MLAAIAPFTRAEGTGGVALMGAPLSGAIRSRRGTSAGTKKRVLYPAGYNGWMIQIRTTQRFDAWIDGLRDRRAKARIQVRIDRVAAGLLGDVRPVGEGVSELRINYGPGYRVYLIQQGQQLILLLAGGDKSSQDRDIPLAIELARQARE